MPQPHLCEKCLEKPGLTMMGTAEVCGHRTNSGSHKYCLACARAAGICQNCGEPVS